MSTERIAMPASDRYYSYADWLRVRHVQEASPRYVESFLHHEGLKCVTTGERYYLEPASSPLADALSPQAGNVPAAVAGTLSAAVVRATQAGPSGSSSQVKKALPDLVPGLKVRVAYINIEMNPIEEYRACSIREHYAKVFSSMLYGDLFFEPVQKNQYNTAEMHFTRWRSIGLFWDGLPEHTEPEESVGQTQQDNSFPISLPQGINIEDWYPHETSPPLAKEEQDLELPFPDGLSHFHLESLPPDRWYIFQNPHSFLLVGSLVLFTSNLDSAAQYFNEQDPRDLEVDGFSIRAWEGLDDPSNS